MGVVVYKATLGTTITGQEGKQRLLVTLARIFSIFYNGAIKTINLEATEPMTVVFKVPNRAEVSMRTKEFSEQLVKDLMLAESFEIVCFVSIVQVRVKYTRSQNMDNSVDIDLRGEYKENMSKYFGGFVLSKNIIATQQFYERLSDRVERVYNLMLTLFKKFLGDTVYHTINRINVERYNRDIIYFNFFGNQFTIKRKYY